MLRVRSKSPSLRQSFNDRDVAMQFVLAGPNDLPGRHKRRFFKRLEDDRYLWVVHYRRVSSANGILQFWKREPGRINLLDGL